MEDATTSKELDKEIKFCQNKCSKLRKLISGLERELEGIRKQYSEASNKAKELEKQKRVRETKENRDNLSLTLDSDWVEKEFPWSQQLKAILRETFKFNSFRPKQLAAINATLSKKDVLLVMPTGGGKSLVYQLPALVDEGFSLIVSPLISLIEDQLIALKKAGINAASVNGSTPNDQRNSIYKQMLDTKSGLKLLYVTPEWVAKSKRFMSILKQCYEKKRISRVAIDEVHCCSTWGHDFRPDYGFLGLLRTSLATIPFLGLTATATMNVLTDVQAMLNFHQCMIITAPFNRPNLFYKVLPKPSTKEETLDYLEKLMKEKYADESGIIYTNTISESTSLANDLKKRGVKVAPYHASLEPDVKKQIHSKWLEKKYQAVIATVAFGMGIDKPDVRFVVHHMMPRSMESLYQESGRAGRDGNTAECIVLYSLNDCFRVLGAVSSLLEEKRAYSTVEYCLDQQNCRRSIIATHFEEIWDESHCNKMCDHCDSDRKSLIIHDITKACADVHALIEKAHSLEEKLTVNKLIDAWLQTGPKKMRINTLSKPKISKQQAEVVLSFLLLKKYLSIDKGYTMYSTICYLQKGKNCDEKIEMASLNRFAGFPRRFEDGNEPPRKKSKNDD